MTNLSRGTRSRVSLFGIFCDGNVLAQAPKRRWAAQYQLTGLIGNILFNSKTDAGRI